MLYAWSDKTHKEENIMNEKYLLELLEEMRRNRKINTTILSAYVNAYLRGGEITRIYKCLSKDIYNNLIILRTVAKQYLKLGRISDLNISSINEEIAKGNIIIMMFKAAGLENTEFALKSFIKACDLAYNYEE